MAYTYSLILFLTVMICFIASFNRQILFSHHFGAFIKSAILVAIPFIAWDIWFTAKGVWWFNTNYTLGIVIAGLPLEEWLFFICIPFSCVFTYYCFDKFFKLEWLSCFNNLIVFFSIIVCSVIALLHYDKIYTLVTAITTITTLIYLHFIGRADWISKASLVFIILLLGFFPVNGILTGTGLETPIVNYNPSDFLDVRMGTIPVEDAVYGYTQFLWLVYFFKQFKRTNDVKAKNKTSVIVLSVGLIVLFNSCSSMPKNAKAVKNFDINKYLGTWYEIARFDFRFEKDLNNVSAQYSLNKEGNVIVLNSGYNYQKNEWKKADGLAKFRGDKDLAELKVSFFGPFYAAYNVIALDGNYQYALIAGKNLDYLWILSRTKSIPEKVKADYLKIAKEIGYDTSKLIWVKHNRNNNPYLNER